MSLSIITHNGKKVLYINYQKCKTAQDMLNVLESVKEYFEKNPGNHLTINDFTGVVVGNEFMSQARLYSHTIFDSRTERSAVIGVTGLKKMLLSMYNTMVTNKQVPFYDKNKALNYVTASDVYRVGK